MIDQRHFVMRKVSTGLQRKAWYSPSTGELYCGICLRGRVHAAIGSECTVCNSQAVREFSVLPGGYRRPAKAAIRTERRTREEQRAATMERTGNLVVMRAG
jgi:hypothetical protein